MSIENPYGISPGWKIDPDGRYDRKPSEVTTRQMTEEERQKYGNVKGQSIGSVIPFMESEKVKTIREREKKMGTGHRLNINTEDLLRVCRIRGTGKAGYAAIAEELGMSVFTAKRYICERGIVKLLKAEKEVVEENKRAAESVGKTVDGFSAGESVERVTSKRCPQCGGVTAETNEGKIYCLSTDCRYIWPISDINSHEEHVETANEEFVPIQTLSAVLISHHIDQPLPIETEGEELYRKGAIGKPIDEACPECGQMLVTNSKPIRSKWCATTRCKYNKTLHPDWFSLPEETEEYPDLKAVTEGICASINDAARESARKISLHNDVDEMMEMVPDNRKPTKYYIATGYRFKDRAKQLSDFIKAVGGEITCEWWNFDESVKPMCEVGDDEFKGVRNCDVFICLLPGFAGTHSELGAAVMLGKRVIIHASESYEWEYGELEAPCYFARNVKQIIGSELALALEIIKVKETA